MLENLVKELYVLIRDHSKLEILNAVTDQQQSYDRFNV